MSDNKGLEDIESVVVETVTPFKDLDTMYKGSHLDDSLFEEPKELDLQNLNKSTENLSNLSEEELCSLFKEIAKKISAELTANKEIEENGTEKSSTCHLI